MVRVTGSFGTLERDVDYYFLSSLVVYSCYEAHLLLI
jgi:hypothetical protein